MDGQRSANVAWFRLFLLQFDSFSLQRNSVMMAPCQLPGHMVTHAQAPRAKTKVQKQQERGGGDESVKGGTGSSPGDCKCPAALGPSYRRRTHSLKPGCYLSDPAGQAPFFLSF